MESKIEDIEPKDEKDYKAENIIDDKYRVFFTSCLDMSEIPDNSVHLHFTSIPYATMRGTMAYGSYTDYLNDMYAVFREMYRTLKPGRVAMINVSDYQISEQLDKEIVKDTDFELGQKFDCPSHMSYLMYKLNQQYAEHYELQYRDTIIWKKSGSTSQRAGSFVSSGNPLKYNPEEVTERILVFRKGDIDYRKIWKEKRRSEIYEDVDISTYEKFEDWVSVNPEQFRPYIKNIWEISPETQSDHPAPFSLKLPEIAIQLYTVPREIVVDPFLGSATTIKAAMKHDRKGVGYENLSAESDNSDDFENMIRNRLGTDNKSLMDF